MASSSTAASTTQRPAPRRETSRCHLGDLPLELIHRILFWKLLANGEAGAVIAFATAAPYLAARAGRVGGFNYITACGLVSPEWLAGLWDDDEMFWEKFYELRDAQRLAGLIKW